MNGPKKPMKDPEDSEFGWALFWILPTTAALIVTLVFGVLRMCEVITWKLVWIFFPFIVAEGIVVLTLAVLLIVEACRGRGNIK